MSDVLLLILRRMRAPLILLILVYAISVFGLALMPGIAPDGRPERLSIFHAFYIVSYTATTIGFGEIPHPFSEAQRLWMIVTIYLSVVGWTYTLGSIFRLTSDLTFRAAVARSMFAWRVRGIGQKFFILCGYGQSARQLARALDALGYRIVVIESRADRAASLEIEDLSLPALAICADARFPDVLRHAGIYLTECCGLLALTSDDNANQTIAIGARTLQPGLLVIARARSELAQNNLLSFGGVEVVNPFATFATNIALDLDAPDVLRLEEWLTGSPGSECPNRLGLPSGRWVIVGYGRFGRAIGKVLDDRGIEWRAVDHHEIEDAQPRRVFVDDDTEHALVDADVKHAAVVVAGTDNDATNLAITTLARRANPGIFVIIRQNHVADRVLIRAARADLRYVQAEIMVHECLQLITVPLLRTFLKRIAEEGPRSAASMIETIQQSLGSLAPRAWTFHCDVMLPGMFAAFFQSAGQPFEISHLQTDPVTGREPLACLPLMLVRHGVIGMLPESSTALQPGDHLLFVGDAHSQHMQQRFLNDASAVHFVRDGVEVPRSWLFRYLKQRHQNRRLRDGAAP
jgi:Trk K+ transport system NAD-binding subunit